jgi:hypothetical protein
VVVVSILPTIRWVEYHGIQVVLPSEFLLHQAHDNPMVLLLGWGVVGVDRVLYFEHGGHQ